ncbi:MAG: ATP-dependent RNA helicase DbpA [Spirochaetes bacterium]|nr:ATP-dependent RNA helicase DbpA [Spirochaetota bacterium]
MKEFSELDLSPEMVRNFNELNYKYMTPVQEKTIPAVLSGRDVLVQAKTGSGKTAAFGTGLLCGIDEKLWRVQALVLCPTRELADQVTKELRRIAKYKGNIKILALCGGLPMHFQEVSLGHQAHIVVGTPGRIERHLQKKNLDFTNLKMIVLDEADRMLDAGFIENIESIFSYAKGKNQKMFFSATFPDPVKILADKYLTGAQEILIDLRHEEGSINHHFYNLRQNEKLQALANLLNSSKHETVIVFCNTKIQCTETAAYLVRNNFSAFEIHGDIEQRDRTEVMIRFSNRSMSILVATDVAARGIDIKDLAAVVNFDMPFEPEVYVHRSGRTARAGKTGSVYSFLNPGEQFRLDKINELMHENYRAEMFDMNSSCGFTGKPAPMVTFSINGGRKSKISPGHILGALTADGGISADDVGRIDCLDLYSYVAVKREKAEKAGQVLNANRIKGKKFIIRLHK